MLETIRARRKGKTMSVFNEDALQYQLKTIYNGYEVKWRSPRSVGYRPVNTFSMTRGSWYIGLAEPNYLNRHINKKLLLIN